MIGLKPRCLNCSIPLVRKFINNRYVHVCESCKSHSALLQDLSKVIKEYEYEKVMNEAKRLSILSSRQCPFCLLQMKLAVRVAGQCDLDICNKCQIVWYDQNEFAKLSATRDEVNEFKIKMPSTFKDDVLNYHVDDNVSFLAPLGLMSGFPSDEAEIPKSTPWVTGLICVLMFLCTAWFIQHEAEVLGIMVNMQMQGSVKAALKLFFMGLLVQGTWFKLLMMTLLFYSFGDNVEDRIGKLKFVMLILTTHLANTILFLNFYREHAGIFLGMNSVLMATMTCYSLIYPNYKIYMNRYWMNFRINLQVVIFGTIVLDAIMSIMFQKILGAVSITSNILGVLVGAIFYFAFCEEKQKKST